jgi:hypothetical protein
MQRLILTEDINTGSAGDANSRGVNNTCMAENGGEINRSAQKVDKDQVDSQKQRRVPDKDRKGRKGGGVRSRL